jgi:hypothetical protein
MHATDGMLAIVLIQLAAIARVADPVPVVVDDPRVLQQEAERVDLSMRC